MTLFQHPPNRVVSSRSKSMPAMDTSTPDNKKRKTGDNHQPHHGLATLSPPWNDILSKEVAEYLTLQDFVHLGAVSKTHRALLGTQTNEGDRILRNIVTDSRNHYTEKGELLYTDQLPTLGELSEEESLKHNAVLVARLRKPALRRRSLILFPPNDQEMSQELRAKRKQVVSRYRAVSVIDYADKLAKMKRLHPHLSLYRLDTRFVAVNLSGVNVYVHFIDWDGTILERDGDCIPPCSDDETLTTDAPPNSFVIRRGTPTPPHVFRHCSRSFHSFALCFEKGGPPFAIYQQRRAYNGTKQPGFGISLHAHAISILPGGIVRELNCDIVYGRVDEVFRFSYRRLGADYTGDQCAMAKFAKDYYGMNLPPIDHVFWHIPSRINPTGEMLFYEIFHRRASGDGNDTDDSMLPTH